MTGLVGLMITFWKDVIGTTGVKAPWLAYCSWYALLASAFSGIWMLMALTGVLAPIRPAAGHTPSIRAASVVIPSIVQVLTFVVGFILLVMFGQQNYR